MFFFFQKQSLIDAHAGFKNSLNDANKACMDILGLDRNVRNLIQQNGIVGSDLNPYTTITAQVGQIYFNSWYIGATS